MYNVTYIEKGEVMVVVSATEVRNNFKDYLDMVNRDCETVHIVRERGTNAVLISEEDWESIQETLLVYQNQETLTSVRQSIKELDEGEVSTFVTLDDLRARRT
jgi:antitoxin YefM